MTRLQRAATVEFEIGCRQRAQPSNGLFERNNFLIAHIFPKQACEIAVSARVRIGFQKRAFGRERFGIRAKTDPGQSDFFADIVLGHQKINRADATAILDHQVHGRVLRRAAAQFRNFRQRFAG